MDGSAVQSAFLMDPLTVNCLFLTCLSTFYLLVVLSVDFPGDYSYYLHTYLFTYLLTYLLTYFSFTVHSINMTNPIQTTYFDKLK
jgi:hypothetical protein